MPFLALLVLLCACSTTAPVPRMHTLEYSPPIPKATHPLPLSLRIQRFAIAPDLRTQALLIRPRPYTRTEMVLEQWRALPSSLAADFLRRDLVASGLFTAVFPPSAATPADVSLEGMVEEWTADTSGTSPMVRMGISITAVDHHAPLAQAVVFQRRYDETETAQSPSPTALVEAMSRSMARIATRIIDDLYQALAQRHGQAGMPQ
jgi:ABC-type uncharacterized transport system auxiliary subunit